MQNQVHDGAIDCRRKIDDLADAGGVSSPATTGAPGVIWPGRKLNDELHR
jgi:hypothetical protein